MLLALSTTGKVVLLVVAGTFIVFALVTAMVVPRRRPEFPGDRLGAFLAVVGLLFLAQMAAVVWVAETQESEKQVGEAAEAQPAEGAETEPARTETEPAESVTQPPETETAPAQSEPGTTETGAAEPAEESGDAAAGEQVFASAGCGSCHTLSAAGTSGNVGPSLDEAQPSLDKVVERVSNGQGVMPSFRDQLSEQQIRDVAAFVSESTRS